MTPGRPRSELTPARRELLELLLRETGVSDTPTHQHTDQVELTFTPSPFQRRMWFLREWESAHLAYHVVAAYRLSGPLDVGRLEHALQLLVARHEALRTAFVAGSGDSPEPLAKVSAQAAVMSLPVEAAVDVGARLRAESRRPLDLGSGLLLRAGLLREDATHHVLYLVTHHIAVDGWSMGVLVRDLVALYSGDVLPPPTPLRALLQEAPDQAASLDYWQKQLAGNFDDCVLPADFARPSTMSFRGGIVERRVAATTTEALRRLSREQGVTLFGTLLAILNALLWRYAPRKRVLVATAASRRDRAASEASVAPLANLLLLLAHVADNPRFSELLARVHDTVVDAFAHADAPFEHILEALPHAHDAARPPLVQVVFALHQAAAPAVQRGDVRWVPLAFDPETAKFDLTLSVLDEGDELVTLLEYNADLFTPETAARMADHYQNLLEGVVANPHAHLTDLPLLTEAEARLIAHPAADLGAADARLEVLFEQQARRRPNAPAITYEGQSLTYAELDARAGALARRLAAHGIGPGSLIGVRLERSLDITTAILGVLKAGAAYLPVDQAAPDARVRFMLEDSGATACLSADLQTIDRLPSAKTAAVPAGTAYVIYTSGSTGQPKGVVVSQRNVVRLFATTQPRFGFSADDVWTLFHSIAFDFAVWEQWGALLHGGRLVVVPHTTTRSPIDFLRLLARERVTILNQTPAYFRQVMAAEDDAGVADQLALRWIIFGGEMLDPRWLAPWFARHGDETPALMNMYGITETTVHATWRRLRQADATGRVRSPIGRPLPDMGLYVLDEWLQHVPTGIPGQLYVKGGGVATGYLNRPELTAARFVPDPTDLKARLYASGDTGCMRPDGDIEYLGRADDQIKIRGFRVELGEVESALLTHPSVRDAAAALESTADGDSRLVAYVVRAEPTGTDELRTWMARSLPDYMLPAAIVFLERLPLTINGKLDRRALHSQPSLRADVPPLVEPRTELETTLTAIWADVLRVARVGIDDSFFALGGDSILSIRVSAAARRAGFELPIELLLRAQTIRNVAHALEAPPASAPHSAAFELLRPEDRAALPGGVVDAYPMTALQSGMLFHAARAPDGTYHDVFAFDLRGQLIVDTLQQVLVTVAAEHPALRTTFALADFAEPLQLVAAQPTVELQVVDVPADAVDWYAEWVSHERARGFDWEIGPLVRFCVHRMAGPAFRLSVSFHHSILDGWSVATLMTEVLARYMRLLRGEAQPPIATPDRACREFAALERAVTESEAARRFWTAEIEAAAPMRLARAQAGVIVNSWQHDLDDDLAADLQRLARQAGLSLKSLLLAAHVRVLASFGGAAEVLTGVVVNGRPETAQGDRALGLFLNTLPLALRLGGGSWRQLAEAIFRREQEWTPHRRFPLARIQALAGGQQLFDSVFNFVHFHIYEQLLSQRELELLGGEVHEATNFALATTVGLSQGGQRIRLSLSWREGAFQAWEIDRLGHAYLQALGAMRVGFDTPHRDLCLVDAVEREELAGGAAAAPREMATAHELVAARAREMPLRPAVSSRGRSLTYADLDAAANAVAWRLRGRGVGPEATVAVKIPRSLEMVVAWLGVLKAGGAYVPVDPALPAQRVALILQDCRATTTLESADIDLRDRRSEGPLPMLRSTNLAYVIYTSGTTGRPKGVAIPHRGLSNLVEWSATAWSLTSRDVLSQVAPLGFDAATWEIWSALGAGAHLVLADPDVIASPPLLVNWLHQQQVTVTLLTTPLLQAVADAPWPAGGAPRIVNTGGDRLTRWPRWPTQLVNNYGPTENSVVTSAFTVPATMSAAPPIGRAISNVRVYVLDPFGQPSPRGFVGDLSCAGINLFRGYLGQPGLTAQSLVPNPFSATPGAVLYRTGDRARFDADGQLEFLGRADRQVKVRGNRIELGEVEDALRDHPHVHAAVAAVHGERLVAHVVPAVSAEELIGFVAQRLPAYMVPQFVVGWDSFPLTPNGKVDLQAIRGREPERTPAAGAGRPATELERHLAEIWAETLEVAHVGVDDSFFISGGTSLSALRLVASVRHRLGVEASLPALFAAPTVRTFARSLTGGAESLPWSPLAPLHAGGSGVAAFCVAPLAGLVTPYMRLARALGTQRAVFGLQSRGLDGREPPQLSVSAIAAEYLAAVRVARPRGPFLLVGWSFGATVALEMAVQLQSELDETACLVILDAAAPVAGNDVSLGQRLQILSRFMRADLWPYVVEYFAIVDGPRRRYSRTSAVARGVLLLARWLATSPERAYADRPGDWLPPAVSQPDTLRPILRVTGANTRAAAAYQAGHFAGHVLLLRTRGWPARLGDDLGWGRVANTVDVAWIPGTHMTLLHPPYVNAVAQTLGDGLRQVWRI